MIPNAAILGLTIPSCPAAKVGGGDGDASVQVRACAGAFVPADQN